MSANENLRRLTEIVDELNDIMDVERGDHKFEVTLKDGRLSVRILLDVTETYKSQH